MRRAERARAGGGTRSCSERVRARRAARAAAAACGS